MRGSFLNQDLFVRITENAENTEGVLDMMSEVAPGYDEMTGGETPAPTIRKITVRT